MQTIFIVLFVVLAIVLIGTIIALFTAVAKLQAATSNKKQYREVAEGTIVEIFTDDFREQLRNHGRLFFEKIINDNASFLQQDLHLTAADLNTFMEDSLRKVLNEEFDRYKESIEDAKQIALDSIKQTHEAMDAQRKLLEGELKKEVSKEQDRLITEFNNHMAEIVNHYVVAAIADEIDIESQANYIFNRLESQKEDIIKDIRSATV